MMKVYFEEEGSTDGTKDHSKLSNGVGSHHNHNVNRNNNDS